MSAHHEGRRAQHRPRLPDATSGLNHSILSGTLIYGPRYDRKPFGEPVALLRLEFPVADHERPHTLWTWASCEVEVSGQLSKRWAIADGRTGRGTTIVAPLVGPPPPPAPAPRSARSSEVYVSPVLTPWPNWQRR